MTSNDIVLSHLGSAPTKILTWGGGWIDREIILDTTIHRDNANPSMKYGDDPVLMGIMASRFYKTDMGNWVWINEEGRPVPVRSERIPIQVKAMIHQYGDDLMRDAFVKKHDKDTIRLVKQIEDVVDVESRPRGKSIGINITVSRAMYTYERLVADVSGKKHAESLCNGVDGAGYAKSVMMRYLFDRVFPHISTSAKKSVYLGVLDIVGSVLHVGAAELNDNYMSISRKKLVDMVNVTNVRTDIKAASNIMFMVSLHDTHARDAIQVLVIVDKINKRVEIWSEHMTDVFRTLAFASIQVISVDAIKLFTAGDATDWHVDIAFSSPLPGATKSAANRICDMWEFMFAILRHSGMSFSNIQTRINEHGDALTLRDCVTHLTETIVSAFSDCLVNMDSELTVHLNSGSNVSPVMFTNHVLKGIANSMLGCPMVDVHSTIKKVFDTMKN